MDHSETNPKACLLSPRAKQPIRPKRHNTALSTLATLRASSLEFLGGSNWTSYDHINTLLYCSQEGYAPFSQFKFATPRTSSWQHDGLRRAPQTLDCRGTIAAAEARERRGAKTKASCMVALEVV